MVRLPANKQLLRPIFLPRFLSYPYIYPYRAEITLLVSIHPLGYYVCMDAPAFISVYVQIKTHGSESQGKEEAGLRDKPVNYLQVTLL